MSRKVRILGCFLAVLIGLSTISMNVFADEVADIDKASTEVAADVAPEDKQPAKDDHKQEDSSSDNSDGEVIPVEIPRERGWIKVNGIYFYRDPYTLEIVTGWLKWNNNWYYFKEDGEMAASEWIEDVDAQHYYLNADGKMLRDGWFIIDGSWYCLNKSGSMVRNDWRKDGKSLYYLGDQGKMLYRTYLDLGSKHYYLDSNGKMHRGWNLKAGKWIYFGNDGAQVFDTWVSDSQGNKYFINSEGNMLANQWLYRNNRTYLLDKDGVMQVGWRISNGKWINFNKSGAQVKDDFALGNDGKWYFLDSDGYTVYDRLIYHQGRVYLLDKKGVMQTGWRVLNGRWVYFRDSGSMVKNGWAQASKPGQGGTKWYYLGADGYMLTDQFLYYNGDEYLLAEDGSAYTGWLKKDGKWAFYNKKGTRVKSGWFQDDKNNWYLLDSNGELLVDQFVKAGDKTYLLGVGGKMQTGWEQRDGKWYFFDRKDGHMYKGFRTVGNKKEFFDTEDGHWRTDTNGHWLIKNGLLYTPDRDAINIGSKVIIVSIADQMMWGYNNGDLFSTYVTTGARGMDTPTGVFKIMSKSSPAVLTGPGYSSYVDYWMLFASGGYGIHDSSWRSSYGLQSYRYYGSHGCVNTPSSAMKKFYNTFPKGTVVYVY